MKLSLMNLKTERRKIMIVNNACYRGVKEGLEDFLHRPLIRTKVKYIPKFKLLSQKMMYYMLLKQGKI